VRRVSHLFHPPHSYRDRALLTPSCPSCRPFAKPGEPRTQRSEDREEYFAARDSESATLLPMCTLHKQLCHTHASSTSQQCSAAERERERERESSFHTMTMMTKRTKTTVIAQRVIPRLALDGWRDGPRPFLTDLTIRTGHTSGRAIPKSVRKDWREESVNRAHITGITKYVSKVSKFLFFVEISIIEFIPR